MRATFNLERDGLSAINTAAEQFAIAQEQVASGKAMRLPSDNPSATEGAIGEHTQLGAIDSYTRANDAAASRQSITDSVLSDVIDKLTAALTTTTAARGSTADQSTRDVSADALLGIRDALAGDVNTTYQGSSLFAGSKVNQTPYVLVGSTWTYQGDNAPVQTTIDNGRQVAQSWDGQAILQGSDSQDVLTALDNLAAAVRSGDSAGTDAGVTALQNAFRRATQAQSQLGSDENSVDDARSRLSDLRLATDARRSKDEDANLADAATRMSQAQVAYRAALSAVSKIEQTSLLDYLK